LSFDYSEQIAALHEVSLDISPGDRLALVGQNGSGKTTLAKLLVGLLEPKSGQILLDEKSIESIRPGTLARKIGFVFQNPDHQIFSPTVWEEIAFGPRNLGLTGKELERRIEEALALFNLRRFAALPPASLSFGLRRQVSIASVFAMKTPILILDEPSLGMDWHSSTTLMERLISHSQGPRSLVFISHDLRLVAQYAKDIAILHEGTLLKHGPSADILHDQELLRQVGMEPLPIAQLSSRLATLGIPKDVIDVDSFSHALHQLLSERGV
jgi:energy-coupling factor transport system ATP-binding protein